MPIMRFIIIEKAEVLAGLTGKVEQIVEMAMSELLLGRFVSPVDFTISGYDDDPRDLSEIPEVREWYRKLHEKMPFVAIFLGEFCLNQFIISLLPVMPVARDESQTDYAIDPIELTNLFAQINIAAIDYMTKNGVGKIERAQVLREAFQRVYSTLDIR